MRAYISNKTTTIFWTNKDVPEAWRLLSITGIFFFCLLLMACETLPPRPFSSAKTPLEFIDHVPMEDGTLQKIALHYGYEVKTPANATPMLILYYLDLENEQKEALASINIDGRIVNEYARKSIFAVSWDEMTLLYMHHQSSAGPESLQNKTSGLYEHVVGRGDKIIYPQATIISYSSFQLARNAIEFAVRSSSKITTKYFVRSTEGVEFVQDEVFLARHGGTELHRAAKNNDLARASDLLALGYNLEAMDNRGFTPLHTAIWEGKEEMAGLLVRKGANVNIRMLQAVDWSPIEATARFGQINILGMLLDHGADINSRAFNGATPLHLAIKHKKFDVTEMLVNRGADVNLKTNDGITPLHLLSNMLRDERANLWIGSKEKDVLRLLITNGADVNAIDNSGATALHYSVLKNNLRTSHILVQNGANAELMELRDTHYYGTRPHHSGSNMTLDQRIDKTLESSWWRKVLDN